MSILTLVFDYSKTDDLHNNNARNLRFEFDLDHTRVSTLIGCTLLHLI